jgi:AcrR family transcriptional regulator
VTGRTSTAQRHSEPARVNGGVVDAPTSTRQRILQAVIDGLTELDPAALTIQQVCARAEVTAPTLYYHFGSKDGLTAAAVDSLVTRWIDQLDQRVERGGSLEDTLAQAVAAWHMMITSPQRPFAVFVWVSMWSEESRSALVRAREHAHRLVEDTLVGHLGSFPHAEDIVGMLMDGVIGAAVDYQLDADEDALHHRLSTLVSLVHGLAAADPAPTLVRSTTRPDSYTPSAPTRPSPAPAHSSTAPTHPSTAPGAPAPSDSRRTP